MQFAKTKVANTSRTVSKLSQWLVTWTCSEFECTSLLQDRLPQKQYPITELTVNRRWRKRGKG